MGSLPGPCARLRGSSESKFEFGLVYGSSITGFEGFLGNRICEGALLDSNIEEYQVVQGVCRGAPGRPWDAPGVPLVAFRSNFGITDKWPGPSGSLPGWLGKLLGCSGDTISFISGPFCSRIEVARSICEASEAARLQICF